MNAPPLPLEGLLVADFSRVLAGPYAAMALADLGARVVKVERTGTGDETRAWAPPASSNGSTYFDSVNRNKESLELDLTRPADRRTALELARRADVLIENLRPGTMQRHGLGADDLRALNPGLVYASISGFGSGAGATLPGYDFLVQAVGGLMSITGEENGPPMKVGVALVDVLAGKDVLAGVLAALVERGRTGAGAHLEVNLLSSLHAALVNQGQSYLGAGVVPHRLGNAHPSIAPYQLFACRGGSLAICCGNDAQFAALCRVLGVERLTDDDRFRSNRQRVAHRAALVEQLEEILATAPPAHWSALLREAGVPAGGVATVDEAVELARSLGLEPTLELVDAAGRPAGAQLRPPVRWVPARKPRTAAPPALGQHNRPLRAWLTAPTTPGSTPTAAAAAASRQQEEPR